MSGAGHRGGGVTDFSTYLGPEDTLAGRPAEGGIVGRSGLASGTGKVDGPPKVTGAAVYTADLRLPRMAHAKLLRSPHAHARILAIDAAEALAMPGVLAVLTGADLPGRHGPIPVARDETALAVDKVRYRGEPVACVAAVDEATAREALARVRVDYEPLPAVFTLDEALDPGSPAIHEHLARKAARTGRSPNVLRRVHQSFGDPDAGFAEADLVMEESYFYPGSTHVPLEPHAALAAPEPGGRLRVWTSTQNPHSVHRTIAAVLGLDPAAVRLTKPEVGGGYGGKCDTFVTELCASALALRLGRPVRLALEREEVFYAHRGRHPTRMRVKMGLKADGRITALELEALANGGAYASYGVVTAYYLGVFGTLPYRLDHYRFTATRVYTNLPPCGPKRGHGAIQPRFAIELHLDRMAHALGLDPAEVRLRNAVEPNTVTVNGLRVTSVGLRECVERVVEASGYRDKRGRLGPGRGVGLAASAYMSGALHPTYANEGPHSMVQVKVDRSGRVTILSGTADIGQGSNHMLATVVAERLGIEPADCTVVEADTDLTPVDLGSYSSRVTFMAGNAALQAAERVRKRLVSAVSAELGCDPADLVLRGRRVFVRDEPDRGVDWRRAIALAEAEAGALGAMGSYRPPRIGNRFRRQSVGPSPAYSFTAQVAEVSVDLETGEVRVEHVWCAHDLGRVLHPEIAAGQIEGCVYMGVGEALLEEQAYRDGLLRAPSLLEYRVPTVHETPAIHPILVESHDPEGPFGAKEVGEGPQLGTVPAIAAAIHDATGAWLTAPPYTPDKVLAALRRRGVR